MLKINNNSPELIRELEGYKYQPIRVEKYDDAADALRYFFISGYQPVKKQYRAWSYIIAGIAGVILAFIVARITI